MRPAGGWLALQRGVSAVVIVGMRPPGEDVSSFLPGTAEAPLQQRPAKPSDVAIGPRPVNAGAPVGDPGRGRSAAPRAGAVAGTVVGRRALDR